VATRAQDCHDGRMSSPPASAASIPKRGAALLLITTIVLGGATAARAHGGKHASLSGPVTEEERAAYEAARPAFERHCFRCHTAKGRKAKQKSLSHLSMDRYPLGGHHAAEAGAVIRRVLGAGPDKKPATMPSDDRGAVTGDDLSKILAWADAFERAHPPKAAPAAGGHHH
jgi:hypothetical protein